MTLQFLFDDGTGCNQEFERCDTTKGISFDVKGSDCRAFCDAVIEKTKLRKYTKRSREELNNPEKYVLFFQNV